MSRPLPNPPPTTESTAGPPVRPVDDRDLPDPLQDSGPPDRDAGRASTEGLLSELAGQEIDRLLCESTVESDTRPRPDRRKAKPPAEAPAAVVPPAVESEAPPGGDLDRLFAEAEPEEAHEPLTPAEPDEVPDLPTAAANPLQEVIGIVALVTLLNAVAVMIYVFFVR